MLYMILGTDAPDSMNARTLARPKHLDYLQALQDQGRLILAGPRPRVDSADAGAAGFHGSLIVAEFDSIEAARAWAAADPYAQAGVFSEVLVQPFVKVFPR